MHLFGLTLARCGSLERFKMTRSVSKIALDVSKRNVNMTKTKKTKNSASDLSVLAPSSFVFAKLAERSCGHVDEIRQKSRQIFPEKNRRKPKPTVTEVNENRGITVF
ncbi:hypothetical protein AVEN_116249-1 [Araneus ventricosus]|uniref:Uncharacterized protein n=1 Tax=Araneus ventricosus TaxID=182803 RepID=A0A4Y2NXB3_ARAVE|nr:hypothetical protein AVEN_116249-1 [Araneus ventricosus]